MARAHAVATAHANDGAATRAYIRASEAYARGGSTELAASLAAIEARANAIAAECPATLTYAPRDEAFEELGYEARMTLFYAGVGPQREIRLAFATAIGRLRWSDRRLTRLVHTLAAQEMAVATVALPDVCADIAGWKASAYATLPQSVTAFLAAVAAIESRSDAAGSSEESLEEVIMGLLGRYENAGERAAVRRLEREEERIGDELARASASAQAKLAALLGVTEL